MKKLMVFAVLTALLLSLGGIMAAAELPEGISFYPGEYSSGDGAFSPMGDIPITWDPEASQKLDLTDGDLSDWMNAGYSVTTIGLENMAHWVEDAENGTGIPEGWSMTAFFAADSDNLYLAFLVTDPHFTYAPSAEGYSGDAIQLALDFGYKLGAQAEYDPAALSNPKNVFYSFSCVSDGAPLEIHVQESDRDGVYSEAKGDGVKGCATATENGWSVELALSFDMMWGHYKWKEFDDDAKIYVGSAEQLPLRIGCCLYYLDRSDPSGTINWAAGTHSGITDDTGAPCFSWTVFDNGMRLDLMYEEGMNFTSEGIMVIPPAAYETEPPLDFDEEIDFSTGIATEPYTELASEAQTLPPVWEESYAVEWEETIRDAAEDPDKEAELNAILEKYGCTSTLGLGSLAVLLIMAAAAYVTRKKK